MLARVSNIETFRRWRLDESQDTADLVARLTDFQPTEAMEAGTAFHKALELAAPGEYAVLSANGYTFHMEDGAIALPSVRELRCYGQFGPLRVTGQVDALFGRRVEDHKTTANFNADGYLEGCQWRFYLDLFDADVFRWNVFEIREAPKRWLDAFLERRGADRLDFPGKHYIAEPPHTLEQYRYPGLHDDCMALAADYYAFAIKHLPNMEQAA